MSCFISEAAGVANPGHARRTAAALASGQEAEAEMAVGNGVRLPVAHAEVFPHGCHLVPDSITEAQAWDEATRTRSPAADKVTGKRVWQVRVMDMDPALEGRSREVVVKVAADRAPAAPTGTPFELVEFEGLTVTPYVDTGRCKGQARCGARMAFSLRATGIKAARPAAKDAA
jgi:hypothetical protein